MTDRELLELAAKAAGFKFEVTFTSGIKWNHGEINSFETFLADGKMWNPLTDDGDALRLAVQMWLHFTLFIPMEGGNIPGFVEILEENGEDPLHVEYFNKGEERLSATRRAIVRAAAEIGKG